MAKKQFDVIHAVSIFIFLVVSSLMTSTYASDMRAIELTDGTVIAGEIVSLSNGVYTVKSVSLGTIQIGDSKIRAIRAKGSRNSPGAAGDEAKSLQEKIMGNGEIMSIIQGLQSDQDLQEILRDPEIMKAVQAGDISALASNPKFIKLLDKKEIQQIRNKISQ